MTIPNIDIVDMIGLPPGTLEPIVAAIQIQVSQHAGPIWGFDAVLSVQKTARDGNWACGILRYSDVPDALAYHAVLPDGTPYMRVFWQTDLDDHSDPSEDLSHEILEALGDPMCDGSFKDYATDTFYSSENCDPVQGDSYKIGGVSVSNFVYPAWFGQLYTTVFFKDQYDFMHLCTEPFQVRDGGYTQTQRRPGKPWRTVFGSTEAATKFDRSRKHRAVAREMAVLQ